MNWTLEYAIAIDLENNPRTNQTASDNTLILYETILNSVEGVWLGHVSTEVLINRYVFSPSTCQTFNFDSDLNMLYLY